MNPIILYFYYEAPQKTIIGTNSDLFEKPIRSGKVRSGVLWHQYRNGCININGEKYFDYSIKDAVKIWRAKFPFKR